MVVRPPCLPSEDDEDLVRQEALLMIHAGPITCLLLTLTALAGDPPRQEVTLNGSWEHQLVGDLANAPDATAWQRCTVPGYFNGTNYQRVWLRRSFTVPPEMHGQRIEIHFGGVKYNSRVLVNGREVGGCFGGYQPFDIDVTDAVRLDGPNELLVGCHDWTGVFSPGKVDFSRDAGRGQARSVPRDKILSPVGGLYGQYGIWDDVILRSHPAVHIKDLFIKPSVRRGELVVEYTLANESATAAVVQLRATVEDQGSDVLELPSTRVEIPAGESASVTLRQPWPDAPLWSHTDPHLLHLRSALSSGDELRTRFGFREFWVEGHDFYLNGVKIHLLATSWWPPRGQMSRDEIGRQWEAIKRCGCVAFRTHTQPWPSLHYEVADEVGLLMIVEGAVWNDDDTYRINDPVFWNHYADHLRAMIDRDKNRPSVVMWSLENEFFGGRLNDASPAKADLVRIGRLVKQWDPTRPMFYESDGDPGGVADAIGIHYPHEYPDFTCWPNEAWWLAEPQKIDHMFQEGRKEFLWKKDKPLYIGEFLWLPSRDPSWHTVFFGDEAYLDYKRYRDLGKAESWRMQILGYRHFGVAGISPWTVIEGGPLEPANPLYEAHQYAYQPIAAYCHDYDSRFYAGQRIARRIEVFNDILEPSALELRWELTCGGELVDQGQHPLALDPAGQEMLEVVLNMPKVQSRTAVDWRLSLRRNGRPVFDDTHRYWVFPPIDLPKVPVSLGLYDPPGATARRFKAAGLRTTAVTALSDIDANLDVLVVGSDSLAARENDHPVIGRTMPERRALLDFASRGGRVLVLRQEAYPQGMFDLSLTTRRSTMTFPTHPGHPALAGVEPADLKFWRGDHLVATHDPARPVSGGALAIVVSGSATGIDNAPLVEQPVGRGCIVYCQMNLIEKMDSEPAAARILANLIEYLARYSSTVRRTAVLGGTDEYHAYLNSLGLQYDVLTDSAMPDLSACQLLVCRGGEIDASTALRFVEQGGTLVIHRASPAAFEALCRGLALDITLQPYTGPIIRAEGSEPLLKAITREDLYWLGPHVGIDWAETPRADEMVDGIFAKSLDGKDVRTLEIEDWKLEGQIVERRSPGVVFATTGSASTVVDFPATGDYVIGLVARGTPAKGEYPLARVSIDQKPLGLVAVADGQWHTVTTFGRVEQGRHEVSVAFINDGSNPPAEDRNLNVDKILIASDQESGTAVRFLASPPAIGVARRGKGMIVLDQVRWDTEPQNTRKAARYAGALLAALGGNFTPRLGVAIECEQMTPQPEMPFFRNLGAHVSLACNGYVKAAVEVAATGRYTMEVTASGTKAAGVYPLVEVRIDGKLLGQVQLISGNWRPYSLPIELAAGTHELSLALVNDLNQDGEDRNLMLDKVIFYQESP